MASARSRSAAGIAASTLASALRPSTANGSSGSAASATAIAAASAPVMFNGGRLAASST